MEFDGWSYETFVLAIWSRQSSSLAHFFLFSVWMLALGVGGLFGPLALALEFEFEQQALTLGGHIVEPRTVSRGNGMR